MTTNKLPETGDGCHCALCGRYEDQPVRFRPSNGDRKLDDGGRVLFACDDCVCEKLDLTHTRCRKCHVYFVASSRHGDERLCPICEQEEQDAWDEEHPDGVPHFYEYSPAMRPCGRTHR